MSGKQNGEALWKGNFAEYGQLCSMRSVKGRIRKSLLDLAVVRKTLVTSRECWVFLIFVFVFLDRLSPSRRKIVLQKTNKQTKK